MIVAVVDERVALLTAEAIARFVSSARRDGWRPPTALLDFGELLAGSVRKPPEASPFPVSAREADAAPMSPLYVTRHQAAEILGVSVATVDRLVRAGRLQLVKVGRATRIPLESITGYADGGGGSFRDHITTKGGTNATNHEASRAG